MPRCSPVDIGLSLFIFSEVHASRRLFHRGFQNRIMHATWPWALTHHWNWQGCCHAVSNRLRAFDVTLCTGGETREFPDLKFVVVYSLTSIQEARGKRFQSFTRQPRQSNPSFVAEYIETTASVSYQNKNKHKQTAILEPSDDLCIWKESRTYGLINIRGYPPLTSFAHHTHKTFLFAQAFQ